MRPLAGSFVMAAVVGLVSLGSAAAAAPNPCRAACKAEKKACVQAANAAFAAAKAACAAQPGPAERRACKQAARTNRTGVKALCKGTQLACLAQCSAQGTTTTTLPSGASCNASSAGDWLATVNFYRALADVPALTEDAALSPGDQAHAQYMVQNDVIGHSEDPGLPGFSAAGNAAAMKSNVTITSDRSAGDGWAIDSWMRGPFHAIGIIDPQLAQSGFGIAHDTAGTFHTAAALDVLSDRTGSLSGLPFPLLFPGDGKTVPLDRYDGSESPDPLTSCPGYAAPTGLPLLAQFVNAPSVTAHSLKRDGADVEHCIFDGSNYTNPDASSQDVGRAVLAGRNAVVIIPRAVLVKGSTYQASLTVDGQTTTWSFTLACQ